ncbi:hypothetical protein PCH_Pc21g12980 [Penicillium rubens Wisconsin 54-1255]|uniref:Uncharacterized protein n=1 Tax=Penicillium rubens (strain ATCC 28089 / DSM 1075 / NRRL 1951 / Wisconsin 54-1255) TaxID=500485 RepID=B6HMF3_PENRW|nr:hypothetical protein PCH_Pc21g12980 [Penicillium rubens Wisconsin 54-1255]
MDMSNSYIWRPAKSDSSTAKRLDSGSFVRGLKGTTITSASNHGTLTPADSGDPFTPKGSHTSTHFRTNVDRDQGGANGACGSPVLRPVPQAKANAYQLMLTGLSRQLGKELAGRKHPRAGV